MKKGLQFLLLFVATGLATAGTTRIIHYEASYIGVPLLDMKLTWSEKDSTISIIYDNQLKSFIGFFHPIHNIYKVEFKKDSYDPLNWSKEVSEGNMQFTLSAIRSVGQRDVIYSNHERRSLPEEGFTVFSATHLLASKAADPGYFPRTLKVLIDGEIWEAQVSRYTPEKPHQDHHVTSGTILIQADLHYLGGERVMQENDILMDVIASEGSRFLLWVAPDGHYTKAQFGEFPRAVILDEIKAP